MIDDILTIQKCSNNSVKINAVINAFVESKKLKLSKDKCHNVHIQKKLKCENSCKKLKVYNDTMQQIESVKYLVTFLINPEK